jgi:hypothetical protein
MATAAVSRKVRLIEKGVDGALEPPAVSPHHQYHQRRLRKGGIEGSGTHEAGIT